MDALGVYIFAGGFTQGVRRHINVVAHFEDKPYSGTLTSQANFPEIPIYFRSHNPWPMEQFRGIDLVFANPPCAIFSPIGIVTTRGPDAWKGDPRLNCWLRCFKMLDIEPKILMIESVPQALTRGREFIDSLALDAMRRGYKVTYLEHDAGNYGTPQHRKRFFFIASKYELQLRESNWGPVKTVGEALDEVDDPGWQYVLREDLKEVYPHMKRRANGQWEGIRVAWCRMRGIDVSAKKVPLMPMFMLHRLSREFPAGVFCGNYWLHPDTPRYLGINELKVLCGYPKDYVMQGREGMWPTLLAQAVLPPVGEFVGSSIRSTLEMGHKIIAPAVVHHDIRKQNGSIIDITHKIIYKQNVHDLLPVNTREINLERVYYARAKGDNEWFDKRIRVLAPYNPRTIRSRAFEIFKLYETGLKVRDFIEKGGRLQDVRSDVQHGYILVE